MYLAEMILALISHKYEHYIEALNAGKSVSQKKHKTEILAHALIRTHRRAQVEFLPLPPENHEKLGADQLPHAQSPSFIFHLLILHAEALNQCNQRRQPQWSDRQTSEDW